MTNGEEFFNGGYTSSTELESLEQQLLVAKEEALKYKKAARLWKSRYEQERRARYYK